MKDKFLQDDFSIDENGNASVCDKLYQNRVFDDFVLNPNKDHNIELRNIRFEDCSVNESGGFIMSGCILNNVEFINFSCGSLLSISSEAQIRNVKVVGHNTPAMVLVRSETTETTACLAEPDSREVRLDISLYHGEVSITGIPSNSVIINSDQHVVLDSSILGSLDWKSKGISGLSYWKMMYKKVLAANSKEGIFSMPPKNGKNYDRSMNELELLRKSNLIK